MSLFRSKMLWAGLAVWASFWVLVPLVATPHLFDLVNALSASIGIGVIVAYSRGIYDALTTKNRVGGHYLILGIACTWLGASIRTIYNWIWRWLDKPEGMIDHPFVAFMMFVVFTGGALHLTAQNAIEGCIPRKNWIVLGAIVSASLFMTFTLAIVLGSPDYFH